MAANSSPSQYVGSLLQGIELVKFSPSSLHRKCGRSLKSWTGLCVFSMIFLVLNATVMCVKSWTGALELRTNRQTNFVHDLNQKKSVNDLVALNVNGRYLRNRAGADIAIFSVWPEDCHSRAVAHDDSVFVFKGPAVDNLNVILSSHHYPYFAAVR